MSKKNLLLICSIFTAVILFGVFHNASNQRHHVEFFSGSNFSGYEQIAPTAQIDASPAIAWKHTSGFLKFLGGFFLGAMWLGFFYVASGKYLGNNPQRDRKWLAYLVIFGPLVLSFIFFFAAYSSGQTSNTKSVTRERFDGWVQTEAIKQRGEKTFVDTKGSDTLKTLFTGNWIK